MQIKFKGSITIFLALTLLLMIGIVGSLLESSRVTVSREVVMDDTYLSVQNILAEYQREIWNDYHVFFVDAGELGGTDGIRELGNKYLKKMLDGSSDSDFIGMSANFDNIELKENMTESNCYYFTQQVRAFMKYGAASALGKKAFKNAKLIQNCEKGANALKRVVKVKTEAEKKVLEAARIKNKAKEKIEKIKNRAAKLKELSEKLSSGEKVSDAVKFKIAGDIEKMRKEKTEAEKLANDYDEEKKNVEVAVREYDVALDKEKDLSKEVYSSLKADNAAVLEDKDDLRSDISGSMSEVEGIGSILQKDDLTSDELKSELSKISTNSGKIAKKVNKAEVKKANKEVKEHEKTLDDITADSSNEGQAGGWLSIFLPEGKGVSKLSIEPTEWNEIITAEARENSLVDKGSLMLYSKTHFNNFTSKPKKDAKREALMYGHEYLIIGKDSDEANLTSIVNRILGIRTLEWYTYFLTRQDKVAEARAIAIAVAGVLGIPAAIKIIETGILMGWSANEARKDIKTLLKGEKINLYPMNESIKVDYNNIIDSFLAIVGGKLPERLVRLIEQNIKLRYNKNFRADNMFAGISADVSLSVKPRIFRLSFLDSLLDKEGKNGWKSFISVEQSLCRK